MATIEDYIEQVINKKVAGLAVATEGLSENVENIYEIQRKMMKESSKNLSPLHNSDVLPLFTGNQYQIQELMDRLGTYNSLMSGGGGDIPNVIYDNLLSYFNKGRPAQIIGGLESEDHTPVGTVPHPAPLDITSCAYWTPLVVQFGERLCEAAFPKTEINNDFMNEISIAKTLGEVAAREKLHELEQLAANMKSDEKSGYSLAKENNYKQKTGKSRTRTKSSKSGKASSPTIMNSIRIDNKNEVNNDTTKSKLKEKSEESPEEILRKLKGYLV